MQDSLNNRLRSARIELGLTQAEAASAIGIKQPMLHRAETSMEISSNRLLQILDYYINQQNINPAWLLREPNTAYTLFSAEGTAGDLAEKRLQLLEDFRKEMDRMDKAGQ